MRILAPVLALVLALGVCAEEIKVPASRDVWLSTHKDEADYNMGAAPKIKLKFIQEFGILDFDVSALKGKTIEAAWLCVTPAGGHKWGLNGGTDLRHLSLATVGHDWVEGKSAKYGKDEAGHGATYNESSFGKEDWGWPGANVEDVTLGNCQTWRFETKLVPHNGTHRAPVDPRLVQALVAGASHGVFIMDGTGEVIMNCFIYARESGKGPFLIVKTGAADTSAPGKIADLKAAPAPNAATTEHGALRVRFTVPPDTFAYRVTLNGKPVERWQIPFAAKAGEAQSFEILDLPPETDAELAVTAVDAAGNASEPAIVKTKTGPKLSVPALPPFPFQPKGGEPKALGAAKVWAFPEVTKVDPVGGKVLHEKNADAFRQKNPVWDGADGSIRLAAARGEIVSFQLAVEGQIAGVGVKVSALSGAGEIPAKGVRLWRNWYVKGQSEYAIPLKGTFDCPMPDNKIQGQTLQAVTVDCHVPLDAKPGEYTGKVTLSAGEQTLDLPLKIKVYAATIPETVFFNPELNCYKGPGTAGNEQWFDSFRIAHYHRCTINRVAYSHTGRVHGDYVPQAGADGKVTDWSTFDKNLGPLLSGEAFKDNPRAGVPVATLYLPHFEGWPLDYRKHYQPGCSTKSGNKEDMTRNHILAKPLEEAMDAAYQKGFTENVRQFGEHLKEKGWNRTMLQMYQNNKGWKGDYCLWTLDEPYKYEDWHAINFWARLFKNGANDPEFFTPAWHEAYFQKGGVGAMGRNRPTFVYRGDISRLNWQGSLCDGLMGIAYGGGNPRLLRNHRQRMPAILYTYGGTNGVERSNWESAAWCLRAYTQYQDGVLPWQSLGGEASFWNGDPPGGGNALIVDSGKLGFGHALASFRVHALRRGAQDCELLRLLQLKKNWSRGHIELLVGQRVPIASKHRVSDAASAVKFESLTSLGFAELKEGLLQMLAE